jgi:hypothetical protein
MERACACLSRVPAVFQVSRTRALWAPICLLIALAPGLSGCGGDDEGKTGSAAKTGTTETSPPAQAAPVGTETGALTQPSAGDDEAQAQRALEAYLKALGNKNAAAACDLLSDSARRTIEQASNGSCENGLDQAFQLLSNKQVESFGDAKVSDVEVTGDKAKAVATVSGRRIPATLQKVGGQWKIGEAAGLE